MRLVFYGDTEHTQSAVIWHCRDELEKLGIKLMHGEFADFRHDDIAIVHSPAWSNDFLDRRCMILDRVDGAQLTMESRRSIKHPNVLAILKHAVYSTIDKYNERPWRGHEVACLLRIPHYKPIEVSPPPIALSDDDYKKIKCVFSFAAEIPYAQFMRSPQHKNTKRVYLLNFIGTTKYETIPWLEWHRRRAVEAIREIPGEHAVSSVRGIGRKEYWNTLRQSRICVSPWGCGEPCWRDYEAILCGCVVIKPDTTYIDTQPKDFYRHPAVVSCAPDFTDLAEAIERAKAVTPEQVEELAQLVIQSCDTTNIAKRIAEWTC